MFVKFKIEVIGLTETNKDDSRLLKLRLEGKIGRILKFKNNNYELSSAGI